MTASGRYLSLLELDLLAAGRALSVLEKLWLAAAAVGAGDHEGCPAMQALIVSPEGGLAARRAGHRQALAAARAQRLA